MSIVIEKGVGVRVTNTIESSYTNKKKESAGYEFAAVTPKHSKFIKLIDTAILNLISQSDPEQTFYLMGLLTMNKPEHQSNVYWFPTSENPGKKKSHTRKQTRVLNELYEIKMKEKMNLKKPRNKFF